MADVSPEMLNVESLLAETEFAIGVYVAGLEPEDSSGGCSEKPWAVEEAGVSVSFDWIEDNEEAGLLPGITVEGLEDEGDDGKLYRFQFSPLSDNGLELIARTPWGSFDGTDSWTTVQKDKYTGTDIKNLVQLRDVVSAILSDDGDDELEVEWE